MKIKLENNDSSMFKKYEIYQNETCRVCIKYVFILVRNSNTPYIVQTVLSMTLLENEFKINSYIVMFFKRNFFTIEKCN